ncbi:transporter [Pseudonocardiaceae bacterium YIM PH 21723]|nr:transporter [Pseudonocardiaceae bacterium YIM PH 21723]
MSDIWSQSLADQRELLRNGELSSVELVRSHLERIERHDPELNAFRVVWADQALEAANRADEQRAGGEDAPLLGLPIAIKEDLEVAGEPLAFGTDQVHTPCTQDAEALLRLRRAGAIILGRTREPELGLFPYTSSKAFGETRNPWSTQHSPGGSSGGSAAAVAGGLAAAALGSDGSGSIRIPAAHCNLFGLKPQVGRISLHPSGERWTGMVAMGPLTRTVRDWAILGDVLRGSMPGDLHQLPDPPTTFEQAATRDPGPLRIGVSLRPVGVAVRLDDQVRAATLATAELLRELGHDVVERNPRMADGTGLIGQTPRYLGTAWREAQVLGDLDALDPRTATILRRGARVPQWMFDHAVRFGDKIRTAANEIFDEVDVLLTPTLTTRTPTLEFWRSLGPTGVLVESARIAGYLYPWNHAGNPAASVPAGFDTDGLPIGIQLVGRQNDECTLLSLAAQLEAARPWDSWPTLG